MTQFKETLTDPIKKAAKKFLKKKDFHQTLRNEILFAIAPRTLKSGVEQRNGVLGVMYSLQYGGFLRDEGFKQLGTMIEMSKIIGQELKFNFRTHSPIDTFCQSGKFFYSATVLYSSDPQLRMNGQF